MNNELKSKIENYKREYVKQDLKNYSLTKEIKFKNFIEKKYCKSIKYFILCKNIYERIESEGFKKSVKCECEKIRKWDSVCENSYVESVEEIKNEFMNECVKEILKVEDIEVRTFEIRKNKGLFHKPGKLVGYVIDRLYPTDLNRFNVNECKLKNIKEHFFINDKKRKKLSELSKNDVSIYYEREV